MTLSESLMRARALLAGGWHEPFSLDAADKLCDATAEGISKFCVEDAVRTAAAGDATLIASAEQALELQLVTVTGSLCPLSQWLVAPERKQSDVVALFSRAVRHAAAEESR
ncbi:MAG: hypothetical protein DI536_04135 [Archangium gephyra]|uniref:Uncharacterized protein n=1 Tax=Archangium gephyra TaxID=48 RepID=A0A2W5TPB7_9BACT|nr:MAG: hypothetical protein DI536_04135 [Archangium gephyra]